MNLLELRLPSALYTCSDGRLKACLAPWATPLTPATQVKRTSNEQKPFITGPFFDSTNTFSKRLQGLWHLFYFLLPSAFELCSDDPGP